EIPRLRLRPRSGAVRVPGFEVNLLGPRVEELAGTGRGFDLSVRLFGGDGGLSELGGDRGLAQGIVPDRGIAGPATGAQPEGAFAARRRRHRLAGLDRTLGDSDLGDASPFGIA